MGSGLYRVFVFIILMLTLPVQLMIVVCVVLTSGFPVLFMQKRIGKHGKPFTLYKFRTMVADAEKRKSRLRTQNEANGVVFKIHDDPRFTRIGRFLSHTGFDELPQLYNIVKGDMVFFGPRPLPVSEARKLTPWMHEREKVLPGIVSPAILTGTYHKDFKGWMRSDVEYTQKKSVLYDLGLLIRVVPFAVRLVRNAFFT